MSLVRELPYTHPYRWDGTLFGGPRLWRPNDLGSALALWLDAEDAASITLNGATVSQWSDKSGNNRNATQATAANQPTWTASGLNNKPVVRFDGAGDTMVFPQVTTLRTFVALTKWTDGSGDFRVIIGDSTNYYPFHGATAIAGTLFHPDFTPPSVLNGGKSINGVMQAAGSLLSRYITPTIHVLTTTAPVSVSSFDDRNLANRWFFGDYAEMIILDSPVSESDRQKLEGYLAWKWALESSLPSGHPYKNRAPTQ